MTAVYREVILAWKGKEYKVQPSYRLVQQIESNGISIVGVINRLARGEPPLSQVAEIVAALLRSGGCKNARGEEVYNFLMSQTDPAEIQRVTEALIASFMPSELEDREGNDESPTEGATS